MKALTKKEIQTAIDAWETAGRGHLTVPQRALLVRMVTQDLRCSDAFQAHLKSEITERDLIDVLTATWINEPLMHRDRQTAPCNGNSSFRYKAGF
jgi:hypothetical protein